MGGRARETYLAVVKCASDSQVVDILVQDGGHLGLLDGAHATLGVEDEDGDILLASQTVDGGRTGVTARGTDNSQMMSVCATC